MSDDPSSSVVISNSSSSESAVPLVNASLLINYIRNIAKALLSASDDDLDSSFGEKYNIHPSVSRTCDVFVGDHDPTAIFLVKNEYSKDSEYPSSELDQIPNSAKPFSYKIDPQIQPSTDTLAIVAIIKKNGPLEAGIVLDGLQLQSIVLPIIGGLQNENNGLVAKPNSDAPTIQSSPYEVIHSILHFAIGPYFDAYCKAGSGTGNLVSGSDNPSTDDKSGNSATRRKITELELSFLHLQQNMEIGELTLSLHPIIEQALKTAQNQHISPSLDIIPPEYLKDTKILNSLQANVNGWIRSIQALTRISRDPKSGTAMQEINFWLSMEVVLRNIELQLQSRGVTLTLDILRNAKRFIATVSFLADTGIKEASETVAKYNQLMRDFPLDELVSASTLTDVQHAIDLIFNHLNKKLRITPYPVWRALALVEGISSDLETTLRSLLRAKRLMYLDFSTFKSQLLQVSDIFATWDENVKEFINVARELTRKRSEKFIPIRITPHHATIKERLEYVLEFRSKHDQMYQTLIKVLGNQQKLSNLLEFGNGELTDSIIPVEFSGINPLEEISIAYDILKQVDILDTTNDGMTQWNTAEKLYNERTTRVEQAIIAVLRDRLAVAKNSNEMFRVFSKFNALFVNPSIRGAIQEYQTRLIDNVKVDISALQDRFRQQYSNSEAYEMSKLRDMPMVAGTIGWIRQIETQLDMYMQRVEDVLGKGWQMYADGQKLYMESSMFRKKLDTSVVYQEWLNNVSKRNLTIDGTLFVVIQSRNRNKNGAYELQVNFEPQVISLFKEVRNLQWMNYQVPHSVVTVAKDAKRVYPFAVSLIDSLRTFFNIKTSISTQYPELEPLLYSSENTVYNLIAKSLQFRWESFSHVYDFEAITNDRAESKPVKLIHDIEEAVNALQTKSDALDDLYREIEKSLQQLKSCTFDFSAFSSNLQIIQESVDKLNLELYSNVPEFVKLLNTKIKNILVMRCKGIIDSWISIFQNPQNNNLTQHRDTINIKSAIHELTLRNQVVSLSPPIESTRVLWLINLQDLISSVTTLKKIEANRFNVKLASAFGKGKRESSFADIPLAISSSLLMAYKLVDDHIHDAEQYLDKWYQFQDLWDLEPSQVFDILGDNMEKWLQILGEIRKARSTFDTNDVSKTFGLLKIDFRPVQGRINSKYDAWQREIIYQFAQRLNNRMKEMCNEIESSRRDLERQSIDTSSTEIVVSCITAIQHSVRHLDRWESEVDLFGRAEATLTRYRFQFPPSWLYVIHINNEWNSLNEILTRRTKILDEQGDAVRAKVQSEMLRLKERVNNLEEQWQSDKPVSGSLKPKECLKLLSRYEADTTAIHNTASLLTKAAIALDIEFEIPAGLEAATEEIRDFGSVWSALDTVWNALNDLKEMLWATVVPRKVRQQLDELLQMTKNMPTRIRQYSAFQHIQNVLKSLSKSNSLLTELRSEAIYERHWETLYKKLLPPSRRIYYSSMTLGNVWDMNLTSNSSIIKDVIDIAQGEMALENFLRQVRETWSSYTLELINYQNTCRLIKNWDVIFEKSSDHINSLNAMHHSPYFKVFEEEARAWEEKLNKIHVLFDIWIDVQRQWVYLEGVFNNNAEIKHILPVESSRFQNINSELFVILRKVYKSPLILDVLNIPGIQSSIERLADLLGKVQKALGEYFEKERQRFSRFYFIGDEDLLEIIGNSNDIRRAEKHLSKMFSGISGLVYDVDNCLIKGVLSKEGEQVLFQTQISLVKLPKVVDWLTEVERQTKITLSYKLTQAVDELNKICPQLATEEETTAEIDEEKFVSWIQAFPTQVNLLASQVLWTQSVESCLTSPNNTARTLKHWRSICRTVLTCLANRVLRDLSVIDRKCCESLISELVHQRDILSVLIDENVSDASDFNWQSQMTYHLNTSATDPLMSLSVKQAKASFIYGFEYLGIPEKLVTTPLLDRCFLSMTQALDQRLGGSPFGPAGTGKTESVKALGQALGKHVLVFCCDENFDFQAMGRILLGICQVGAWGCFDEFNRLDSRILSAIASQIETIELGLKKFRTSSTSEIELVGRTINLSSETGIFITMNPEYAGRNTLPENLSKLFKSFSMAKPDREAIAEVILYSQGFVHGSELSQSIVPYFEELNTKLSSQVHYDFGLRALKSVLRISGNLKRSQIEEDKVSDVDEYSSTSATWESKVILRGLRETVSPKLVAEDAAKMIE